MGIVRLAGILLIVAGALGLVYGGFSYTSDRHTAKLGPIVLQVQESNAVVIPLALSAGAIAAGILLLLGFRAR
jgi:hypothetical protein